MNMYIALLIVIGFFAIGDFLGVITKAKLSSVFVALMLFLVLFITKTIPANIVDTAQLTGITKFATAFVVFHMGTSVNLRQLAREWKIVVFAIVAMLVAMLGILVAIPLIGREAALVSIPIVNGGIVATQIMTKAAMDKGMVIAAALGTIVYAVQKFVGTVPASQAGLTEAKLLVADYRAAQKEGRDLMKEEEAKNAKPNVDGKVAQPFWQRNKKYYTQYISIAIVALFGVIANFLGGVTPLVSSIWSLILGVIVGHFGLVPPGILDHAKAIGLFMVATFASLIPSLAQIKLSDLTTLGFQTFVVFAASLIAIYALLYFLPTWKLVGSKNLAIGIAMSQLLGFPATYLIVNEVATAVAENEAEKQYIINKLTPAFVVSGFVSVTSVSVIIAGIFAKML